MFLILLMFAYANANFEIVCVDNAFSDVTLLSAGDSVKSRYKVNWCTKAPESAKGDVQWNFSLKYSEGTAEVNCTNYNLDMHSRNIAVHSELNEVFKKNCSNICLSTSLDLLFSGCYVMKNMLRHGKHSEIPVDSVHYVKNKYKNKYSFLGGFKFDNHRDGEAVFIDWYTGLIPVTQFDMEMCPVSCNDTTKDIYTEDRCDNVTSLCKLQSPPSASIQCRFPSENLTGCHVELHLSLKGPWMSGIFSSLSKSVANFSVPEIIPPPTISRSTSKTMVWGGLAVMMVICAILLFLVCRKHKGLTAKFKLSILDYWKNFRLNGAHSEIPRQERCTAILLLYARDCEPAMKAAKALAHALEAATKVQVLDIHSSEVVSESASAPAEWMRSMMCRTDVCVVLLQTNIAQCLYMNPTSDSLNVEEPLLGSRVRYKYPQCSDSQLTLALRMIRESAIETPYRKFYITTYSDIPVDIVKGVTPFLRYQLPLHTLLLLKDLSRKCRDSGAAGETPQDEIRLQETFEITDDILSLLNEFSRYASEYVEFVSQNQDYIKDEISFE